MPPFASAVGLRWGKAEEVRRGSCRPRNNVIVLCEEARRIEIEKSEIRKPEIRNKFETRNPKLL
jgi:hypothetical protein